MNEFKKLKITSLNYLVRLLDYVSYNEIDPNTLIVDATELFGDKAKEFVDSLEEIKKILNTDLQALYDGDPAADSKEVIVIAYPGYTAIATYRIAHKVYELGFSTIARIMSEHAHSRTGIDIHPGATIDEYFFIDHGTGVVIGQTAIIGKHVKIYQGVTLGALSTRGGQALKGSKRHPTIKDNVTIYSNVSILGDVTIGKNSTIGGNVFITTDIPEDTKVLLNTVDYNIIKN